MVGVCRDRSILVPLDPPLSTYRLQLSKSFGFDHALAQELARGFWASLPYLDAGLIASILRRGRQTRAPAERDVIAAMVESEAFRAALGRIACGYDGGQIIDE